MIRNDDWRQGRRLVVWLVVTLCILAELVGLGLMRAYGSNGLTPPVISSVWRPADPTRETSAAFMFTNERTVAFQCSLDEQAQRACGAGVLGAVTYPGPLAPGAHEFRVRAVSGSDVSEPATYTWTIVAESTGPAPGDGDDGGEGDGSGTGASEDGPSERFEISGDVDGLAPGVTKTIALTVRNPNADPIYVTAISVGISEGSTPAGCASATNIVLAQPTAITWSSPVLVPAHGSVVLDAPPRAPRISFVDLPRNQDVCKGKSFELTYSGSAHS